MGDLVINGKKETPIRKIDVTKPHGKDGEHKAMSRRQIKELILKKQAELRAK